MKNYPMPRDAAEQIIRIILHAQEHQGPTGNTVDTFSVCSHECELQVTKVLARAEAHTSSLRKLASTILQAVRDTRRLPIVACMYFVAYHQGDDDAGFSWATMVMEGLVPTSSKELDAIQAQAAAATYSHLASKGHGQAQFGMGRLVLAKITSKTDEQPNDEEIKQVQMAVDLWQRAGRNGYAEAWFELGQLYYTGQLVRQDKSRALTYFEHGARGGSAQASHALGTIYAERAQSSADSLFMDEATTLSALAARYFLQAAQNGHIPSAYNMGHLYLCRDIPSKEHKSRYGVLPDDRNAREWFAAASSKLFLPAMMNYSAMLLEGRGAGDMDTREADLDEAQRVYTRVIHTGSRVAMGKSAQESMERMTETARRGLRLIEEQRQSAKAKDSSRGGEASPQSMCTVM
jgi:hypothetical protein